MTTRMTVQDAYRMTVQDAYRMALRMNEEGYKNKDISK